METDILHLADILRPSSRDIFSGKGKLCLSANYLNKLNNGIDANIEEDINSFQIVKTNNAKTNLIRDVQFLLDLIRKTTSLKLIPDETVQYNVVDITKFKNVKKLEITKLDVNIVIGLQKLRSQIQELTCCRNLKSLSILLEECGGDKSQPYIWNELRIANLCYNEIVEIDNSFECTPSLHTLDLSHNNLNKADFLNLLPNLKHLNLSYNKLDAAPNFKGQIKNRLQVLVLNNNFIEDLSGILSLVSLMQLDLGHNCLLDHKSLLSISHLVSLQWLNLQGNPMCFHSQHRQMTCNYLTKNAKTVKFSLDGSALSKIEKSLTGSLYPISQLLLASSSSTNSMEALNSTQEKQKKIRNVTIEDVNAVKEKFPVSTPPTPSQHLEIKRQVEQLRKEYGESWLYKDSGQMVQDVLGFDKSSIISSTPLENNMENNARAIEEAADNSDFKTADLIDTAKTDEEFLTAEQTVFNSTAKLDDEEVISDGEDVFSGGEDCMFLANNCGDGSQVFVVVTESHISERDVTTSKERARWHVNTIISCEPSEEGGSKIKLEFDTLRRDRKQRVYELSPEDVSNFYESIKEKIENVSETEEKNLTYQCMKCSQTFQRSKNALLEQPTVICPQCSSNIVVETA
ncbi:unnamed protein product [Phyllotreta striolata]|uniref:LKB1 serine/threonine kinase interacting protein 1 N-terminal domain-containing protein n=1 Tax=Phyllotreta striolata TaxID=444603 RepID=A0A9N9TMM7_PHYSR|nr:unnamed protein product [Phyllotreta striolata]